MKAAREREKAEKAAKIERLRQDAIYTPKGGAPLAGPVAGPGPGQDGDYVPLLSLPSAGAAAGVGGSSRIGGVGGVVPMSKREEMIQRVKEDAIYTPKGGQAQTQGAASGQGPGSTRGQVLPPPRGAPPSFFPPPDNSTARSVVSNAPGPPNTNTNANPNPTPRPGPPPPRPQNVNPNTMMPDSARSVGGVGVPGRPLPPPDSARSVMNTAPGPPSTNPYPTPRGPPPPRPLGANPNTMMPDSARSIMGTVPGPPSTNPNPTPRQQGVNPSQPPGLPPSTPGAQGQGLGPPLGRPPGPPPRPPVGGAAAQGLGPPPKPSGPRGPPINMFG